MLPVGKRIADDPIYLSEDRYEKPKELFKFLASLIDDLAPRTGAALLDVGCATGELIYFLRHALPGFGRFAGVDVSPRLIAAAQKALPDVDFRVGSVLDPAVFIGRKFDVVTCSGVLSCLDDPAPVLQNLLAGTAPGGAVLIYSPFNDDPVDVVMRYRRADRDDSDAWEKGWNIFSCATMERLLRSSGYPVSWDWHPFEMPFALNRRLEDPMRTWTVRTEAKPCQTVNGACQLIDGKVLRILLGSCPT